MPLLSSDVRQITGSIAYGKDAVHPQNWSQRAHPTRSEGRTQPYKGI